MAVMPRALRDTVHDIGQGRYPRALQLATVSWALLGVVLLLSRAGTPTQTDAQATDAATGVTAVRAPSGQQQWYVDLLPWLGVMVLVLVALLFVGHGWARLGISLVGVLALVGLAQAAPFLAIPAALFLMVGAVCSLLISAHRYLTNPHVDSPPGTGNAPS